MLEFDHVAIAARSLNEGAEWLYNRLGVELQPGGKHKLLGTHNMLLSLGPHEYLELIANDPDADPIVGPGWFGLKTFNAAPMIAGWVVRQSPLEAPDKTYVAEVSRADLHWRITLPESGQMAGNGTVPMRISWEGERHPSDNLTDHGLRVTGLHLRCPDAMEIAIPDPRIRISNGPAKLTLKIATPQGEITL